MKKTYVITISEFFPSYHKKAGEKTGFAKSISDQIKIHTIRESYELWAKRAEKINKGEARLSVRVWTGKPYNSKQREVFSFERISVQKLILDDWLYSCDIDGKRFGFNQDCIAENDGLSPDDFEDWFKNSINEKPKAIIHFTNFRYQ